MVVAFTTTYAISAYHHWSCEFKSAHGKVYSIATLSDKICLWLGTGRWFSQCTQVSSTNKTDRHNITEILLKWHNTINQFLIYSWNVSVQMTYGKSTLHYSLLLWWQKIHTCLLNIIYRKNIFCFKITFLICFFIL